MRRSPASGWPQWVRTGSRPNPQRWRWGPRGAHEGLRFGVPQLRPGRSEPTGLEVDSCRKAWGPTHGVVWNDGQRGQVCSASHAGQASAGKLRDLLGPCRSVAVSPHPACRRDTPEQDKPRGSESIPEGTARRRATDRPPVTSWRRFDSGRAQPCRPRPRRCGNQCSQSRRIAVYHVPDPPASVRTACRTWAGSWA